MHAQQIPITPPHPIPLAGPLGAFAGPMGLPHGPQALLKVPQELHRDDIKPLVGPSAEERLVSTVSANEWISSENRWLKCRRHSFIICSVTLCHQLIAKSIVHAHQSIWTTLKDAKTTN